MLPLQRRDAHDHLGMWEPTVRAGAGAVLWFRTNGCKAIVANILETNAEIVAEPHVNPNAQ